MDESKPSETLKTYRAQIDELDRQIIDLLSTRMEVVRKVGHLKYQHNISPVQPGRIEEVVQQSKEHGLTRGVDPDFIEQFYRMMIDHAIATEYSICGNSVDE